MKIAFVVTAQTHEGPLKVVKTLIEGLVMQKHACTLLYLENREELDLPCDKQKISYRQPIDLSEYDIVHSHGLKPDFFVWLHLMRNSHHSPKTVFISTYHSFIFEDFRWKYGRVVGWMLSRIFLRLTAKHDKIVVLSDAACDYYSHWVSRDKLVRCYHGLPPTSCADSGSPSGSDDVTIGMCCPLERIKGVDIMLAAMEYLPSCFQLLVVGDGSQRKTLQQRCTPGKRVTFVGDVIDIQKYYAQMGIYVMASYSEGFCLSLLEAALAGRNIVCSDIPGMREKFTDEEVTFFEAGNPQDLARAILEAHRAPKGDCARQKAVLFSAERMCLRHETIYREALEAKQGC